MTAPVSVLILTYNEEVNLPYALESVVGWAGQIVVVDSYSTDRTVEIAQSYGADVYQHSYESARNQRNWALQNPSYHHEWILYIDADEQVSPQLQQEIADVLASVPESVAGFLVRRRFIFLGKWLRHGGFYTWFLRLFRRDRCRFDEFNIFEIPIVQGKIGRLNNDIIHQDHKSLSDWIAKQNLRASKAALKHIVESESSDDMRRIKSSEEERVESRTRLWLNRHVYNRFPALFRPFGRFLYRYIVRLALLDGWQGFAYSFLLDFWFPLVVELKKREFQMSPEALDQAKKATWL